MSETKILEVPACAAIRWATEFNGYLLAVGKRHNDCLRLIEAMRNEGMRRHRETEIQGFMTTQGRFVDRKEALQLMLAAGRTSANKEAHHDGWSLNGELASEDLY